MKYKYRIKQVLERDGTVSYCPQRRSWLFWHKFAYGVLKHSGVPYALWFNTFGQAMDRVQEDKARQSRPWRRVTYYNVL